MKRVTNRFKSILKKNVVIYKINCLAKCLFKRNEYALVEKSNHLCIEAYPSSANSFLYYYLKYLKSELSIAHHTHTIANIKIALKLDIPIYVIVRNPFDVISSRIIRFNIDINNSVIDYIEFYEFCLSNISKIKLLKFEHVINKSVDIINCIFKEINIDYAINNDISEEVKLYMRNFQNDKNNMSLPDKTRNLEKKKIKERIKENKNFKKAEKIYLNIVKYSKF